MKFERNAICISLTEQMDQTKNPKEVQHNEQSYPIALLSNLIACKPKHLYFCVVRKHITYLIFSILLVFLWMVFGGCTKRYWFRAKVPGKVKELHTVKVNIINTTPGYISPFFVNLYEEKVYKSLSKFGFVKASKDTAEYNFTIAMGVEMVSTTGISRFGRGNTTQENGPEVTTYRPIMYEIQRYERSVANINFKYSLAMPGKHMILWTRDDYVYLKRKDSKDVNRSISVLKLALRKKGEE